MITSHLLIKQAEIVLPQGNILLGDIEVKDGKIMAIDTELNSESAEVIDARGLTLLPGVIDPQVH